MDFGIADFQLPIADFRNVLDPSVPMAIGNRK
jgi:hypothetical protein